MSVPGSTSRRWQISGKLRFLLLTTVFAAVFLAAANSASALTLGVGWSGRGNDVEEMGTIWASGAKIYRRPFAYEGGNPKANDAMVRRAAEDNMAFDAQLEVGETLPTGGELTAFKEWAANLVKRYGYGGEFWSEPANAGVPYKPITVWEVWNEENAKGIGAGAYGSFLSEIANTIHGASKEPSQPTDVLFGGLNAVNPAGAASAVTYLKEAYAGFGSNSNVTGIAINPYELNKATAIANFKSVLREFHEATVSLAGGSGRPLWITESGWPVGWYEFTEVDQKTDLKEAINFAKAEEGPLNLKAYIWYDIRDNGSGAWSNSCGLRTGEGAYRQSWTGFQEETGAAKFPTGPTVTTIAAAGLGSFEASMRGYVDAHGLPTGYWFEWGRSASYGNKTVEIGAGEEERVQLTSVPLWGLAPNETYHYRIVAQNSLGTVQGADQTFTTRPDLAYPAASHANALAYTAYNSSLGWVQTVIGEEVAKGTHVATFNHEGMQNIIFVDASKEDRLADWHWVEGTGEWTLTMVSTHAVSSGSSPTAILVNNTPEVYFSDAASGNTMTLVAWTASGWTQIPFGGDEIAANTSPSAVYVGSTLEVYFVDASKGNIIALWGWGATLAENYLWGDAAAPNTSPDVIYKSGEVQVYFVDATHGDNIAVWGWGSTLTLNVLYGDPAAEGTSPSVVVKGSETQIYMVDPKKGNSLAVWGWGETIGQNFLYGDPVAEGTSPSAVVNNGEVLIFYADALESNKVSVWEWGSSLTLNKLATDPVSSGSGPVTQ